MAAVERELPNYSLPTNGMYTTARANSRHFSLSCTNLNPSMIRADLVERTKCICCKAERPRMTLDSYPYCLACYAGNNISQIQPGLFVSSYEDSLQYSVLASKFNITQILSLGDMPVHEHPDFDTLHIDVLDHPSVQLIEWFPVTNDFIKKGSTLVHCHAGVSRSATVAIAYVMSQGKTFPDAFEICKKARNRIQPIPGFIAQLKAYGEQLRKDPSLSSPPK